MHWVRPSKTGWIERRRADGWRIVAVGLAEDAIALPRLESPGSRRWCGSATSSTGSPRSPVGGVEIPMVGRAPASTLAVAGSLVLYRLAGLC
jgi:hypothetical protein